MVNVSRRKLAVYATDQLLAGVPLKKIAKNLAATLIESKRPQDAELLARDIALELELRGKLAQVDVTTATKINESLRKELARFVKKAAKVESVNLNENIDESVIGGIRLETTIHSWDKTISRKLTDIREAV
jgi:F0F1-type ATP synthase delta subunit